MQNYILVLSDSIKDASVVCCPAPDHKAVTTNICLNTKKRGNGYWNLNNSLLKDEIYKNKVIHEIRQTLSEYNEILSKQDVVELIKVKVKEISICHSFVTNKT